jgi:hypothetical protein
MNRSLFLTMLVLLNYAEAKAELGTITQEDIDRSIKLVRDRVAMPSLDLASIVTDPAGFSHAVTDY